MYFFFFALLCYSPLLFSLRKDRTARFSCSGLSEPCCRCWHGAGSSKGALVLAGSLGEQPGLPPGVSFGKRRSKPGKTRTSGDLGHHRAAQGRAGQPFVPAQALSPPPPFPSPPGAPVDEQAGSPPTGWRRKAGTGGRGKPSRVAAATSCCPLRPQIILHKN